MLYEEMCKITILNCKWSLNNYTNQKFLQCRGIITIRSNNYTLSNSKFNTMQQRVDLYGDEKELTKLQYALQEKLDKGKKAISIYCDLHLNYAPSYNPVTKENKIFIKFVCCDYKFCDSRRSYLKKAKIDEKCGYAKILLLEQELEKEKKKEKLLVVAEKKKKNVLKKNKLNIAKQKNYEMEVVDDIDDNELLDDVIDNDIVDDVPEEVIEKPKAKNGFGNIFGDTKW